MDAALFAVLVIWNILWLYLIYSYHYPPKDLPDNKFWNYFEKMFGKLSKAFETIWNKLVDTLTRRKK